MKQKLTWKFNIVDVVVLLLVAAIVVFLAVKFLKPADSAAAAPGKLEYVVEVKGMEKTLYDNVSAMLPCQMAASGKWVSSHINSVECTPCDVELLEAESPVNAHLKYRINPDEGTEYVNAYFYCSADVDMNDLLNLVGTQEVRIGRSHFVKSVDFELVGTVISVDKHAS